jgi:ring-1,2-phenylacetyl-CoA epoxidase subunit PaaD
VSGAWPTSARGMSTGPAGGASMAPASGLSPAASASVDEGRVRAILATVADPEIPVLSVVDLGVIHAVDVDDHGITVGVLPTFLGCPAIELILSAVRDALSPLGRPVDVHQTTAVPWTSERITPEGRRALAAAGIAPPTDAQAPVCPYCASDRTVMDNAFGPTRCRSLHYCRDCRQPFEAFRSG